MKIREILELTQKEQLSLIAKERLTFGEKKAKAALKEAGCTFTSGKRGWFLDEGTDNSVLEQSIYDYSSPSKRKVKAVSTGIETGLDTGTDTGIETGFSTGTETSKVTGTTTSKETRNSTDLLDRLFTDLQATNDKKEVSFYLTSDVIEVINRTRKGNRSDLVNEALRKVFREKGWL
ncbi:hypothetical protein ACOI1C_14745 [Bacillus sp. DJP31]|uniref:hypothetical protein n=1 Tax=Bacillus sp. DJP31 TaxID=3409789 RepID=UPI003BB68A3B